MTATHRPRRFIAAATTAALTVLALAACGGTEYPNTTFEPRTEFGRTIDEIWDSLLFWGTLVFILVELILLYVVIRFRRRPGAPEPRQVHGNTALEITWTLVPAVILVFIAVPTVRAIFETQAETPGDALQIEVIGHQWWWEFRYPQYGVVTANEFYVPVGRTVSFALKTADVLHSFWVPQMGGKRDLISNHTNYLWFTPDSTLEPSGWNGFCTEYCGKSHANMLFRMFTVTPAQFESWIKHQQTPAAFGAQGTQQVDTVIYSPSPLIDARRVGAGLPPTGRMDTTGTVPATAIAPGTVPPGYSYPWEAAADYILPDKALPRWFDVPDTVIGMGDPEEGRVLYSASSCIGCHAIAGNPSSVGVLGPNLTHVASRLTLGAGMYPNTPRYLFAWIKNAPAMKPGALMPPQGLGHVDVRTGLRGTLTDAQIADIVAYLYALK